jgi:hypothetical protein
MAVVFADADTASLILRMARGTGFAREALARIDAQVVSVIAADVRAAVELGVVQAFDPQVVAEFIVGGIEKIVVRALDEGRAIDVAASPERSPCSCRAASSPASTVRRHALGVLVGRSAVPEPDLSDTDPLGSRGASPANTVQGLCGAGFPDSYALAARVTCKPTAPSEW